MSTDARSPTPPILGAARAEIVVESGENRGFAVTVLDEVHAGRDSSCDLQLFDVGVSRVHFRVRREGNGWQIEDLESRNGTQVNGESVKTGQLWHNDLIGCGGLRLRFLCPTRCREERTRIEFTTEGARSPTAKMPLPSPAPVAEVDPKLGLRAATDAPVAAARAFSALNVIQEISRQTDAQSVFEVLLRSADSLLPCERVVLCRYNPNMETLVPVLHRRPAGEPQGGTIRVDLTLIDRSCRSGTAVAMALPSGGAAVAVPMEGRERVFGAVYLETRPEVDPRPHLPLLAAVCRQAGLILEQYELLAAMRQQKLRLEEMQREALAAQQALEVREEQLQQMQKMEAVGRLAGGVAHDFNNLLTAIFGYCDMMSSHLEPGAGPLRKGVDEIRKAGRRAASLTQQLLAFSRRQILQPRVLDANELVLDMEDMLQRLIGEHIRLLTSLDPSVGNFKADPGQMQQVLLNLVVNSRDAMPAGGTLTILTRGVDPGGPNAPPLPDALGTNPGPLVLIEVQDTGRGMDEATMAHVFEPFFTTKDAGKGTGLGLSTVYGIVTQSGGYIDVKSEVGSGSTFTVYLSRCEPEEAAGTSGAGGTGAGDVTSATILLAEDDEAVRHILADALTEAGARVLPARDGAEALRLAEEHEGAIDLLVTDVVMPNVSGDELARRLARLRPDTRVIFISGYTDSVILQLGGLTRGAAFLQKPFPPEKLLEKVREVLRGAQAK